MSSRKLRFSVLAQGDIDDILAYTLEQWGQHQLVAYKSKIDAALSAIVQNPNTGRTKHGLLVYPAGKHLIYYYIEGETIYVVRILHERMDAARHLDEPV